MGASWLARTTPDWPLCRGRPASPGWAAILLPPMRGWPPRSTTSSGCAPTVRSRSWRPLCRSRVSCSSKTYGTWHPSLLKVARALGVKTVCIPTVGVVPRRRSDVESVRSVRVPDEVHAGHRDRLRAGTGALHSVALDLDRFPARTIAGPGARVHPQCRSGRPRRPQGNGRHSRLHESEARRPAPDRPHAAATRRCRHRQPDRRPGRRHRQPADLYRSATWRSSLRRWRASVSW